MIKIYFSAAKNNGSDCIIKKSKKFEAGDAPLVETEAVLTVSIPCSLYIGESHSSDCTGLQNRRRKSAWVRVLPPLPVRLMPLAMGMFLKVKLLIR